MAYWSKSLTQQLTESKRKVIAPRVMLAIGLQSNGVILFLHFYSCFPLRSERSSEDNAVIGPFSPNRKAPHLAVRGLPLSPEQRLQPSW